MNRGNSFDCGYKTWKAIWTAKTVSIKDRKHGKLYGTWMDRENGDSCALELGRQLIRVHHVGEL
jgi:hypothetical protein